jgi:LemA protein
MIVVATVVVLVAAVAVAAALTYNRLVQARNRCDYAWSDVDALLARRAAAIPRLAAIVEAAMDHERELFVRVAAARAAVDRAGSGPSGERAAAEDALGAAGLSLVAVAEAYPALRASEAAAELITALKDVEGSIARGRLVYNRTVQTYQDRRLTFPGSLLAGPGGFVARPWFGEHA